MCNAVSWSKGYVRFSDLDAVLPVISRDGEIRLVRWGIPYSDPGHPYPKGPCARLESIRAGRWDRLSPRSVRVPISSFSERSTSDRCNYWFSLPPDTVLQGLYVPPSAQEPEGRVYVVTVPLEEATGYGLRPISPLPGGGLASVHERWPRLLSLTELYGRLMN